MISRLDERGVHALVTHRDAVGDGDGDEFEGKPAGGSHAVLRPLGQPGERQVARRDLVPGRSDTDLRLVEVVVRHPDGAEHRPRRRTPETLGHVLAVNLERTDLVGHRLNLYGRALLLAS